VIKLGYANHPAARMWLTYENSLILYLNSHLDEYKIRTGKDMNIPRYTVQSEERPWWITRDLMISHKASLLRKMNNFYRNIFEVEEKYHNHGYIWPSMLSESLANDLINDVFNPGLFAPVAEAYRDVTI